jgi:fructose-bisphosphate aldolase class II
MLLQAAQAGGFAVPCFNVFGFEDARAVVDEAVSRNAPVILATNREMLEFTGLGATCAMLNALADEVLTPVCVHLDHCYDVELACQAVDAGFGSVMYDGSQLDFDVNVANTRRVVDYAHAAGIGVEGEIGSVAYNASDNRGREHIRHELTEPETAARFAELSGADAVAVSIGNVHRQKETSDGLDFDRLAAIDALVNQPLVIHGTSGITDAELKRLTRGAITKCNIGTSLRQCFGRALRETLAQDPDEFDRLTIFRGVMPHMRAEAGRYFDLLGANGTATHLLEKIA